jgi:hypothetical protein
VTATDAGEVVLPVLRGRIGTPAAVQAAIGFAQEQLQLIHENDVSLASIRQLDWYTAIAQTATQAGTIEIVVKRERVDAAGLTCGAPGARAPGAPDQTLQQPSQEIPQTCAGSVELGTIALVMTATDREDLDVSNFDYSIEIGGRHPFGNVGQADFTARGPGGAFVMTFAGVESLGSETLAWEGLIGQECRVIRQTSDGLREECRGVLQSITPITIDVHGGNWEPSGVV